MLGELGLEDLRNEVRSVIVIQPGECAGPFQDEPAAPRRLERSIEVAIEGEADRVITRAEVRRRARDSNARP
jgi:hypothetical protein